MILGYKVENILTVQYFQCPVSYSGKQKPTNLLYWSGVLTIAADLGSIERILHPVCRRAQQYRKGFKGIISSLASLLPSDQQVSAYRLVLYGLSGPRS